MAKSKIIEKQIEKPVEVVKVREWTIGQWYQANDDTIILDQPELSALKFVIKKIGRIDGLSYVLIMFENHKHNIIRLDFMYISAFQEVRTPNH
jgi:hypothetical protein